MGARYVYSVNYRYTCERCGKQTGWLAYKKYAETSGLSTVLRGTPGLNGIGAYLAYDDIKSTREAFVRQTEKGKYSILEGGSSCPHCGERQSWCPPYDFTGLTLPGSIALSTAGYFFLTSVLALIVFIIFEEDSLPAVLGIAAAGLVIGPIRAVVVRRKRLKANRDFLSACTVRNESEFDWQTEHLKPGWDNDTQGA